MIAHAIENGSLTEEQEKLYEVIATANEKFLRTASKQENTPSPINLSPSLSLSRKSYILTLNKVNLD